MCESKGGKPEGEAKAIGVNPSLWGAAPTTLVIATCCESEHTCWDPKGGDLCPHRVKPGEILVEARSGTDVQIVRQMWV